MGNGLVVVNRNPLHQVVCMFIQTLPTLEHTGWRIQSCFPRSNSPTKKAQTIKWYAIFQLSIPIQNIAASFELKLVQVFIYWIYRLGQTILFAFWLKFYLNKKSQTYLFHEFEKSNKVVWKARKYLSCRPLFWGGPTGYDFRFPFQFFQNFQFAPFVIIDFRFRVDPNLLSNQSWNFQCNTPKCWKLIRFV